MNLRWPLVSSLTLVFAVAFAPLPASAGEPAASAVASNYWWAAESGAAPLPAPPTVPPGGLWVSTGPTGPQAVSAVRFTLAGGASDPVINLVVASAQPAGNISGQVVACPATTAWKPGPGPSPWAARPASDCGLGSVAGTLSPDGHTMSFPVGGLAAGSNVDLVIQPASSANLLDVTFEPFSAADVTASLPEPATTTTLPASPPTTSAGGYIPLPSVSSTTLPPVIPASGGLGATTAMASAAPPAPVPGPALAPATSVPTNSTASGGNGSTTTGPGPLIRSAGHSRSWRDRLLLAIAIFDIALLQAWSTGRRQAPAPARPAGPPPLR